MTQGHRHIHNKQAGPWFRVNKSMCRFTNLSHWRSCCSHNIAQNCFIGQGTVLGMTHGYLHILLVYISLNPSNVLRGRKEIFEDIKNTPFVCRCNLISAWNSFICHFQQGPTQFRTIYFRNHSIDLDSTWYNF